MWLKRGCKVFVDGLFVIAKTKREKWKQRSTPKKLLQQTALEASHTQIDRDRERLSVAKCMLGYLHWYRCVAIWHFCWFQINFFPPSRCSTPCPAVFLQRDLCVIRVCTIFSARLVCKNFTSNLIIYQTTERKKHTHNIEFWREKKKTRIRSGKKVSSHYFVFTFPFGQKLHKPNWTAPPKRTKQKQQQLR